MIDAALARRSVGAPLPVSRRRWGPRDVILYHLGIGAGHEPPGPLALRYVYEEGLRVLPGFAATVAHATGAAVDAIPGAAIDRRRALHGEQEIELHAPIPVQAESETTGRVIEVADLGRSALIRTETQTWAGGELLFTTRFGIVLKGAGGFGIARAGAGLADGEPIGPPDVRVQIATSRRQALIYRLCGDANPLHLEPGRARAAGFDAPILHGLSTIGSVLRGVVDGVLDGEPDRIGGLAARFRGPVVPGETLVVDAWRAGPRLLVRASVAERETPVLSHAMITLREAGRG